LGSEDRWPLAKDQKSIGRHPPAGDAEQLNLRGEDSSWAA